MEDSPNRPGFNPYGELDGLIAGDIHDEMFEDALQRAAAALDVLPTPEKVERLKGLDERANLHLLYKRRVGVQYAIIQKVMADDAVRAHPLWYRDVLDMQLEALIQDYALLPHYYSPQAVADLLPTTEQRLVETTKAIYAAPFRYEDLRGRSRAFMRITGLEKKYNLTGVLKSRRLPLRRLLGR